MYKQEYDTQNIEYPSPDSNVQIEDGFIIGMNLDEMIPQYIDSGITVLSSQFEDTLDVANLEPQQEFFPVSPRGPPERTVFAGDVDFHVEINAKDTNKKKYLYSHKLNRIYVDMKCNFPVTFRWSGAALAQTGPRPTLVRACVVFSDESQAEKRVERCTQHTHEADNANISKEIVLNVLHSARERGTSGVYYCGRADQPDSWLSTVVNISGAEGGSHVYQFVCKNSCSSGINRRGTEIIFTLEDVYGKVYGRQVVGARSCSCPRRDMNRDEPAEAPPGKRRMQPLSAPANNKKIKLEAVPPALPDDSALITLPPLQVVGVAAVVTGLEVMAAMMEQARAPPGAPHHAAIAAIRDKIRELNNQ